LQPVQNETGVIFGFVHHFGKPPKQGEARLGPSLYAGLGSSDIFNWAREVVTVSPYKELKGVYKFELGKRGVKAGIVNDTGESITELIIERATGGKCYWKISDNITSDEEAKNEIDRTKLGKVQAFIEKHETVIAKSLRDHAKEFDINSNKVCSYADRLVKGELKDARRIYSFRRKVAGQSGPAPQVYSTVTEPDGSDPINVPVIGQKEMNFRGDWEYPD
jgi:hypothetical protein